MARPRTLLVTALALLAAAGSLGGSCQVAYCSDDCDPCVQTCECRRSCRHGVAYDFEAVHRVARHRATHARLEDGTRVRVLDELDGIDGLSVHVGRAGASAGSQPAPAELARFARGVVEVNGALLAPAGERWRLGSVDVFGDTVVVAFRDDGARASLALLFDRRGDLVEIQHVASAADRAP